jgi:hypothetical protein
MSTDIHAIFTRVRQLAEADRRAWINQVHRQRRTGLTLAEAVRAAVIKPSQEN